MSNLFEKGWVKADNEEVEGIYFNKAEAGKILVNFESGAKDIYEKTGRLEDSEDE